MTRQAIIAAYRRGEQVQDLCDTFGVTRTEVSRILQGVERGMGAREVAPSDIEKARLYRAARRILDDPTHPQHQLLVNLLETATALDPPTGWGA